MSELYRLEFIVQGLPPVTSNGSHRHWRTAARIRKTWKLRAMAAIGARIPRAPCRKARVWVYRHSSREPDFEGMVVAAKPIIDALTERGVITDDNQACIGVPHYEHVLEKPKKGFVRVVVEEVG